MGRKQFTFYRSYYEAVKELNKRDQAAVLLAICDYALNETEPNLTGAAKAVFIVLRPFLDTARRKAEGGMARGKDEEGGKTGESRQQDSGKIPQRYDEDAANKKKGENKKEGEKEEEIKGEEEKEDPPSFDGRSFTRFWDAYPNKIKREEAWAAWRKLAPTVEQAEAIVENLAVWKRSSRWKQDGGRFIPAAAKFLSDEGYWKYAPAAGGEEDTPQKREYDADERAAIRRMLAEG